jgi:magnesium transporter
MEQKLIDTTLEHVRSALEAGNLEAALQALADLRPADRAEALSDLPSHAQAQVLDELPPAEAADILENLEDEEAAEVAARLPTDSLADVLDEMEPNEAADVLGDLPKDKAADALAQMEEAEDVRPLLAHADDTAGGLMTSGFPYLRRQMTAQQAMDSLRALHPDAETHYYLYVVDRNGRLIGIVGLRELVMAKPDASLEAIMDRDVISVRADTDQEDVARLMQKYNLAALPIVDAEGRLVGVVNYHDIVDVIQEEATEDLLRFGGVEGGVDLGRPYFAVPITVTIRKRVGWLLLLFAAETLTGTVLRLFEAELAAIVALSFFIPLLIGTGGNTGAQTVSMLVRGLALGDVRSRDLWRVIRREMLSGLLMGTLLGGIAFGRALLWNTGTSLALVVGLSIVAICTWANTIGALIPLVAQRIKIDPALVSAPLITTLVDATGLAIYFLIAKIVLRL